MATVENLGGGKPLTFEAFEVPLNASIGDESLQGAFAKFRNRKKEELQVNAEMARLKQHERESPEWMAALRTKFVEQAMSYIGTPYAKKYHEPNSPAFSAKLFLDCCGLVRRVLRDLKEEFGFLVGPWNQAYMFDTLPEAYSVPAEMEPGDLVFVSGIYNNKNAKSQPHNIVHVEIWLGEGMKVLGARWNKGRVEVHESYKFEAKSYHSMEYHFRSINSWLVGECKSSCSEHAWKIRRFDPSKHSIFSLKEEEEEPAYSQLEVEDRDTDQNAKLSFNPVISPEHRSGQHKLLRKTHSAKLGRSFTLCEGNAGPLVEKHLTTNGWLKTDHKTNYILKWTELKSSIDYKSFREGEQLVNHFPNINILTTKIGLLESLRTYYRVQRRRVPLESFFPQTFRMDTANECEEFVSTYQREGGKELWICKPTGANQGKGIFLVRELQQVLTRLEQDRTSHRPSSKPMARIVQRYLSNPLLLHGRKFDLRVYMLVVWGRQWVVLFREGYARLCCEHYEMGSNNLSVHLTNQYQQKKSPLYSEVKEDTIWDFQKLQEHVGVEYSLPSDWVATTLTERMISIMTLCFRSVKHKLSQTVGFFELLGFDFLLDSNLNVWLIEANINPALHSSCETLARISPSVVEETLDIAIEVFDKCRRNKTVDPIISIQQFRRLKI